MTLFMVYYSDGPYEGSEIAVFETRAAAEAWVEAHPIRNGKYTIDEIETGKVFPWLRNDQRWAK